MSWAEFYKSRVNSERYFNHFNKKYKPFLEMILSTGDNFIFEAGCGIGSVSKALQEHLITSTGIDLDEEIVKLANENLGSDRFQQHDIFKMTTYVLTVTHGVLEHFSDEDILKILSRYPNSVHYVPLDKYENPSYGDERLLSVEYWLELVKPVEHIIFNDGYDLAFRCETT